MIKYAKHVLRTTTGCATVKQEFTGLENENVKYVSGRTLRGKDDSEII